MLIVYVTGEKNNSRAISLKGSTAQSQVGTRLLRLKRPRAGRHELILSRYGIDEVAHPGVPARLDLGSVVVVLGVLDPARAEG